MRALSCSSSTSVRRPSHNKLLDNESPFMNRKRTWPLIGTMSLSDAAGNASFVLGLLAFARTDMLELRSLALGGTALQIAFQFYRISPLWIPIRWNFLFLAINGTMAVALAHERNQAASMPPELSEIYERGHFARRGFSKVEFCRLFAMGERTDLPPGSVLARDGVENSKL